MIVTSEGSRLRLVTQPDHAHLAGELLALWHADGLPTHPRRAELLFAAREHDNGWREADAAPRWDAERGRPHDFITLPARDRIELWERGTCRFAAARPYAALLIARHALQLFRGRRGEEEWDPFLGFLEDFARDLLAETGGSREELEADYRWIDLADLIALTACLGPREPLERYGMKIDGTRIAALEGEIRLDPFPLVGATTFRVPCRHLPLRGYQGDADFAGDLATARWGEMTVRIAPLSRELPDAARVR
jgi:hypothetical protein